MTTKTTTWKQRVAAEKKGRTTRVFPLDNMQSTFLRNDGKATEWTDAGLRLADAGIVLVNRPEDADVYVTRFMPKATDRAKLPLARPRPLLVWTHEPAFCACTQQIPRVPKSPRGTPFSHVRVMSVWTGDVYQNNAYYVHVLQFPVPTVYEARTPAEPKLTAAIMATWRAPGRLSLRIRGMETDLTAWRQELAREANRRGIITIFGRDWPDGLGGKVPGDAAPVKGRSPGAKIEFLRRCRFNICLEKSRWPYYVTEKIWESLNAQCLPVYCSSNTAIYDTFPKNSFLDTAGRNYAQVVDAMLRMSDDEYIDRLNLCIHAANRLYNRYAQNGPVRFAARWTSTQRAVRTLHRLAAHPVRH